MESLTVLGSGNAFHEDGRKSSSVLIDRGQAGSLLVDCGPASLAAPADAREAISRLSHIFFTHLHGDHTFGWPFLLLDRSLGLPPENRAPLTVIGPEGIRSHLEQLVELAYGALLRDAAVPVSYRELPIRDSGLLQASDGLEFRAVPVEHHPTSLGYVLSVDGFKIGLSGDTAWCQGLESLSAEADLLLLECTSLAPGPAAHISLKELRERGERLLTPEIVLVHLNDAVAAALARDPIPRVLAAHDGWTYRR